MAVFGAGLGLGAYGGNAVNDGGELWASICDDASGDCAALAGGVGRVYDEGSFVFMP